MTARTARRALVATTAMAATTALAVTSATAGPTASAGALAQVTPQGVDGVKLGATYQELRDAGLVGRLRSGCELAGPGTRAAALKKPLRGGVDFTRKGTPRVRNITIVKGAAARGVAVGDRAREIRSAFPGARFDHGTDETFGQTLVKVSKRAGGRLQFLVDVDTKRVTSIGVPFIAFCE